MRLINEEIMLQAGEVHTYGSRIGSGNFSIGSERSSNKIDDSISSFSRRRIPLGSASLLFLQVDNKIL